MAYLYILCSSHSVSKYFTWHIIMRRILCTETARGKTCDLIDLVSPMVVWIEIPYQNTQIEIAGYVKKEVHVHNSHYLTFDCKAVHHRKKRTSTCSILRTHSLCALHLHHICNIDIELIKNSCKRKTLPMSSTLCMSCWWQQINRWKTDEEVRGNSFAWYIPVWWAKTQNFHWP